MKELQYTDEYDSRRGVHRWHLAPGERLLPWARKSSLRVVALGGGTGLPVVLRGLKESFFPRGRHWTEASDRDRLTAVVTVADDGGSSGRLRRSYGILPPGDIRNCLLALAEVDPKIAAVFNFRFNGSGDLTDYSLGNLILTAAWEIQKDFPKAVELGGELLRVRGRVLPATLEDITLMAEFSDGSVVEGESGIAAARRRINRVKLKPEAPRAFPAVLGAIAAADLIVIGPGSLYTSLMPVLLIREIADAIARATARVVLVMNLMTEPGETDGHSALDHIDSLRRSVPGLPIHDALLNSAPIPKALIESYAAEGSLPVIADAGALRAAGVRPVERDLLAGDSKIRHHPEKLAQALLELGCEAR